MLKFLRSLPGRLSMYSAAWLYLSLLWLVAIGLSSVGKLTYNPGVVLSSGLFFVVAAVVFNALAARVFSYSAHWESAVITGLILTLIVGPVSVVTSWLPLLGLVVAAILSKYLITRRGRQIFNPAALGVVFGAWFWGLGASWWVGSSAMFPVIAVGGLLLVWKIGRLGMVASFLLSYFVLLLVFRLESDPAAAWALIEGLVVRSPVLFMAFVMLTEPMSSPNRYRWGLAYGVWTALILVGLQEFSGTQYSFELSLLVSNAVAFLTTRESKFNLILKDRRLEAEHIVSWVFETDHSIKFRPGQYLQLSVPHKGGDGRGQRRYFTIASAPTESELLITSKIPKQPSSFKRAFLQLESGQSAMATGPAGDFVLPDDPGSKLVFIAGGIGITPYRSMIKYLRDIGQNRDIHLIYAVKDPNEIAFQEVFDKIPGLVVSYVAADVARVPEDFNGWIGELDRELIASIVPDHHERWFYISGPESMVENVRQELKRLGVSRRRIKRDLFPGYGGV